MKPKKKPNSYRYIRELRRQHRLILLHLSQGLIAKEIAKNIGKSQATVSEHIGNLVYSGFIKPAAKSSIRTYEFTQKGQDAIRLIFGRYQEKPNLFVVRAHNIKLKCPILKAPKEFEVVLCSDGWEHRQTKEKFNWDAYAKKYGDVLVTKTSRSILFQLPIMYFKSSEEAKLEAFHIADEVCKILEEKYLGLKLGETELISIDCAIPNDPFAMLCKMSNFSYRDSGLVVDASTGNPEIEFVGKDSVDYCVKYIKFIKEKILEEEKQPLFMLNN